jgi:membrane protein DedA with SNARE-associated domain
VAWGQAIVLLLILGLVVGFACGYGVRELISRRRHAAARERFLRRQEQKRAQKRYDDIGNMETRLLRR